MLLSGLQKMTLLDYPGKVAATVFTGGCNFRCPFCHNASLVLSPKSVLSETEFFVFLSRRRGLLDGICVSGGEPLLQPDIARFIGEIKSLGFLVKLDTNGSFPGKLRNLISDGLVDYVAMDIKNSPDAYEKTAGMDRSLMPLIEESAALLLSGAVDYEFRTTIVRELHTEKNMEAIGKWIQGARRYFLQSFQDSGDLISPGLSSYEEAGMAALEAAVKPYVPSVCIRNI
jgi:pyruvate formate lyase activating enzyme